MNTKYLLTLCSSVALGMSSVFAQNVNVDVNLNMEHSVDGESRFGRERRMTIHATPHESDWKGHEDMLDYLINDLDVYFGRETGGTVWKMQGVEEDPNKPGWANEAQMIEHGGGLKQWYESDDFASAHQYESKSNMIMGLNDFSPMYPNLSWYEGFGKGKGGWFVDDTDAAADWVAKYLKHYFAQSSDDTGEPLPMYWECYNEPDMNFMNPSFGMIVSGLEKNWEYHKLVAQEVRAKLGDKAPKIGGMTWGQLDLYKADGIPSRTTLDTWTQYLKADNPMIPKYHNMLSGVNKTGGVAHPGVGLDEWPVAWDNRTKDWWQWDYMYQGFIDYAGADMDFYGVHMYDWPQSNPQNDRANTRSGGHVEAMLDMFEWYDNFKFGNKKDIVMSEFGTVNDDLMKTILDGRRDWLFIKPFNQMMMQFLERPSHVVYSMPFAPTKAIWGAYEDGGKVIRYGGGSLMEPKGTWTSLSTNPSQGWGWSGIIHFFELWKDVEGTRIDTKSNDNDVQVDAYVNGKHVYVILNNCVDIDKTINLNTFGISGNTVSSVELRHIFRGDDDFTKYTIANMTAAPATANLKPNSTIVLDYTYANNVVINQESKETKYMCEPLAGTQKNDRGTQLCHTTAKSSITATIKDVVKPAKGEAIIRVGGFFPNPADGVLPDGSTGMKVKALKVNGNDVIVESDNFVTNTRGYGLGNYKGAWFGVLELECPVEYLKTGENTVYFERWQGVEFTTIMIQVFDMTAEPGRTTGGATITGLAFNSSSANVMNGQTLGLAAVFTPANASDKGLTWTSSNTSAVTVDANGIVTAVANSGSAVITAKSTANPSISASITIKAVPYQTSTVTGITITEGTSIAVDQNVNTKLNVTFTPAPEVAPEVIWTTSDASIVEVLSTGTIIGKTVGESATITATVKNTNIKDEITVNVKLAGGESVSTRALADFLTPLNSYTFTIPVAVMGERTVVAELLKDGSALGSGTATIDAVGSATAEVTVNLGSAPAIATGYAVRLTLKDGATVLSTKTKDVEMKAPTAVAGVSLPDSPIGMIKNASKTLLATISPANASDQRVSWSSNKPAIADIDENGKVTAYSVGEAIITVTTNDQGKKATVTIIVSDFQGSLEIEAEDYDRPGGPQDAIGIYTVDSNGKTGINNVQKGDWVEFDVYIPEDGSYSVSFEAATKMADGVIEFIVDGRSVGTVKVPTDDWDNFATIDLANQFDLGDGYHTFKVLASGSDQWQWNMDKFTLVREGSASGPVSVASFTQGKASIYPNPAVDVININGIEAGSYTVQIINMLGVAISTQVIDVTIDNSVNVSELASGVYQLVITDGSENETLSFTKK